MAYVVGGDGEVQELQNLFFCGVLLMLFFFFAVDFSVRNDAEIE